MQFPDKWNLPDYDEIHWFNEWADRATIKAIVDGTAHPRAWSDIQSTWPWCRLPKPHIPRIEKKKVVRVKPRTTKLVRILVANGTPHDEALLTARKILWIKEKK